MKELAVRSTGMGPHVTRGVAELWPALEKLGWSQNELARRMGVPSGRVNRWMHGHLPMGLKDALEIERLTGVNASAWTEPPAEKFRLHRTG